MTTTNKIVNGLMNVIFNKFAENNIKGKYEQSEDSIYIAFLDNSIRISENELRINTDFYKMNSLTAVSLIAFFNRIPAKIK